MHRKKIDQKYNLNARTDYWVQLFRTKSPSGNSIVMTEAINGKQIRTVDVMEDFITRKDIEVPGKATMAVGTSKKLPAIKQYIATTEMFPQAFQYTLEYRGSSETLSYDNMIELNGDFSWSSSNSSVVEIIGKKMYARKAGKAVLTVTTPLNSASVTVTVKAAPTATPQPTATPKPTKTPTPKLVPVYRLFNTRTGEHFYTAKVQERKEYLLRQNWKSEGIAWYAPEISNEPIYRVSNPNNGNEHHYTKSVTEKNWLVTLG